MAGRGHPHKGEVQLILSQTTSCASCALPPPAWAPFRSEPFPLSLLSLACLLHPFHPQRVRLDTHAFGDAGRAGRWKVCGGGLHLALPPSLELGSSPCWVFSLCTGAVSRLGERRSPGASGYHHPGKHRAHQRQNLTACFYSISCHETHFLGGYTPAFLPLAFTHPFLGRAV